MNEKNPNLSKGKFNPTPPPASLPEEVILRNGGDFLNNLDLKQKQGTAYNQKKKPVVHQTGGATHPKKFESRRETGSCLIQTYRRKSRNLVNSASKSANSLMKSFQSCADTKYYCSGGCFKITERVLQINQVEITSSPLEERCLSYRRVDLSPIRVEWDLRALPYDRYHF